MSKFLKGGVTFTRFKPSREVESIEKIREVIEINGFKMLKPEDVRDESIGWVDPMLSFDAQHFPNLTHSDYLLLSMRIDKYSFGASQMRPYLEQAEFDFKEANNLEYISAQQKKEIKESVIKTMKTHSYPKTTIVEMFWNLSDNQIYLFSQSGSVMASFIDLFEKTFEISIEPVQILDELDQLDNTSSLQPLVSDLWEVS